MSDENLRSRVKKEVTMDLYLALREELRCFSCKKFPRPGDDVLRCPKESRSICEKCHLLSKCCAHNSRPEKDQQQPPANQGNFPMFGNAAQAPAFNFGAPPTLKGAVNVFRATQNPAKVEPAHKPCSLIAKLMQELPFECINVKKGCHEILCKEDIGQHEKFCDYRWINCADLDCKDSDVSFINFADHFSDKHKDCQEFQGPELSLENDANYSALLTHGQKFKPRKILAFDRIFFLVGVVRLNIVYHWIYMLGSDEEAKNYFYRMKMNKDCRRELAFYGQVRSMGEFFEDIIKNELDTFTFTVQTAEQFKAKNGSIQFTLKLESFKEELKDQNDESGIDDEQ